MHDLRELKKEGEVGEDDERRAEAELQKLTDGAIAEIEGCSRARKKRSCEVRPRLGCPRYVAIIMDGNARWAKQRGLGDRGPSGRRRRAQGAAARAGEFGIEELTVYSFSTENWSRPASRGRRA